MLRFAQIAGRSPFTGTAGRSTLAPVQTNGDTAPCLAQAPGRYTVQEAVDLLGTTVEGGRSRIKRGILDSLRVDGKVYILLGGAVQASDQAPGHPDGQAHPDNTARDRVHGEVHAGHGDDRDRGRHDLGDHGSRRDELIAELRAEVAAWREESRRKDHFIAALVERPPPQLRAPSSPTPRDAPQTTGGHAEGQSHAQPPKALRRPQGGASGCIGSSSGHDTRRKKGAS
jgi:hypothetical protein